MTPDLDAPNAIDHLRATLYRLLAATLQAPPTPDLLSRLQTLQGGEGPLGTALATIGHAARTIPLEAIAHEYNTLFIGVGRGELLPYASFYLTGFLHQRPLARLRTDMARLHIAPAPNRTDPEDHIATICEVMASCIEGLDGKPRATDDERMIFRRHLLPWAGRFFADLERSPTARLYAPVGSLGRALLDIDRDGFDLEGP